MKKIAVSFCTLLAAFSATAGDTYRTIEDKNSTFYVPHSDFTDCAIYIKSTITDTLWMAYELIESDVPNGWGINLCDNDICYGDLNASGNMAPFKDPDKAFMKVTVNPMGIAGTATVKYVIWDVNHPNDRDTLSYTIIVQWGAGVCCAPNAISATAFPNPCTDFLQISHGQAATGSFGLFDASGRYILTFQVEAGKTGMLDMRDKPRGVYYLKPEQAVMGHAIRIIKE
jgi:hypothetical protein